MNFMIYMNFSYLFFLSSIILIFISIYMLLIKMSFFMEFIFMKVSNLSFSGMLILDFKSLLFMSMVMMISSMIIIYSIEYMSGDLYMMKFIFLLSLFVMSMLLFIMGQNLLLILLGWDGLGLISYCLVIYYNSWNSYNSGMITILTNRLGDVGLIMGICLYFFYGDWSYLSLMNIKSNSFYIYFILLAALTKSAQVPFSSWLPRAMAAPTPISALVHSSTLVTAGIYLMMRMEMIIKFSMKLMLLILIISVLTMLYSGVMGVFEMDMKKIIALSTLSQLGLMLMGLILLNSSVMYFHMIMHAMFKSLLFMCSGVILHYMGGNQDIRMLGSLNYMFLNTLMFFNCSNLALCGFPFMSGFFSKDLILELSLLLNMNYWVMIIFYFSIMLTTIYSFRLIFYSILNYMKFYSLFNMNDSFYLNISMYLMFLYSVLGGFIFNNLFFLNGDLIYLKMSIKILALILIFMSILLGIFLNINLMSLIKLFKLDDFIYSMWSINKFNKFFINWSLNLGGNLNMKIENGWIEMYQANMLYFYMMKIIKFLNMKISIMFNLMLFLMILILVFNL